MLRLQVYDTVSVYYGQQTGTFQSTCNHLFIPYNNCARFFSVHSKCVVRSCNCQFQINNSSRYAIYSLQIQYFLGYEFMIPYETDWMMLSAASISDESVGVRDAMILQVHRYLSANTSSSVFPVEYDVSNGNPVLAANR